MNNRALVAEDRAHVVEYRAVFINYDAHKL
jgi:hypothetical protein